MRVYNYKDIALDTDGDLLVDADGDLDLVDGSSFVLQDIKVRAMTNAPELSMHPSFGSSLIDLRGEPNLPTTASLGEQKLMRAILSNSKYQAGHIKVRGIPITHDKIEFYVVVTDDDKDQVVFSIPLRL